jgi:hypothetical protein
MPINPFCLVSAAGVAVRRALLFRTTTPLRGDEVVALGLMSGTNRLMSKNPAPARRTKVLFD